MKKILLIKCAVITLIGLNHVTYAELYTQRWQSDTVDVDIVKIDQPQNLCLFLNDRQTHQPLGKFKAVAK